MKSYMADPLNGWQENGGCSEQTEGSVQARILKARRAQKSTSVLKLGIKAREAPNIKKSCGLQQVVLNMNPRSILGIPERKIKREKKDIVKKNYEVDFHRIKIDYEKCQIESFRLKHIILFT